MSEEEQTQVLPWEDSQAGQGEQSQWPRRKSPGGYGVQFTSTEARITERNSQGKAPWGRQDNALKSLEKWADIPPKTIKEPLLAGPIGLIPEGGRSPQIPHTQPHPQKLGWPRGWERFGFS